jgi:hypothetical protein
MNGSNWLAICELWLLETRPVAETAFLADHTYHTQFYVGYPYDSFRYTVWSLRHFELLLQFLTCYGQIGLQVFGQVFGPQDG